MMARFAPEVVANYDPDSAGVAATDRSVAMLLEEGLTVRILRLPGSMDPDEFVKKNGAEAYRAQLAHAQPFFKYLGARALELHGKTTPEAKLSGINFILPFIAKVPNKLIRAELVADIAQKMEISSNVVMESFRKAGMERKESLDAPKEMGRVPHSEAMLIRLLLDNEQACQELQSRLPGSLLEDQTLMQELELGPIVSVLMRTVQSGAVPDIEMLSEQLDEGQQRILAQVVFDKEARPVSLEEISTYMVTLERRRLHRQRLSLQRKIQEAEKARDSQRAVEMLMEQRELDKELARLL
jgi:DNA primase